MLGTKVVQIFVVFFFLDRLCINYDKKVVGLRLGRFFTKSSGHPVHMYVQFHGPLHTCNYLHTFLLGQILIVCSFVSHHICLLNQWLVGIEILDLRFIEILDLRFLCWLVVAFVQNSVPSLQSCSFFD
jgi:hypothetical protein